MLQLKSSGLSTTNSIDIRLMHRALHICEILQEIFVHVNVVRGPVSYRQKAFARKSLAALATTCKTFYEPAMNELWAVMYGLTPLLGCVTRLYPIIYRSGIDYSLFDTPSFQGIKPLSENEGRQFMRHAARVRCMYVINDNCYHLLSVLKRTVTCIFPRLLSLTNQCPASHSDIFLSPTLRRCVLWVTYPDLKVIATHCAALEHLSLDTPDEKIVNEVSLLSGCVRLCKRLITLSCTPLDLAAWKHLSNLPTLTKIAIDGRTIDPSSLGLENNVNFGPFLNLTALSFTVNTAAYITTVMQHSDFPSLKQFEISLDSLPWAEAEQLVRVLSRCNACQTLEQIKMDGSASDVQDPPPPRSSITHFCCFTQLRVLRLTFPHCCIHLDNDLLLESMSSWPHLRSLDLKDPYQTQGAITFRGLFAALRQCPHLHELSLVIDAVNIDIDPYNGSAQVMDVEAVTHIIFSMLPCVDTIYRKLMSMNSGPPYAWDDVQSRLRSLHEAADT
ncbi:hypothetical protein F4604DRAFT_1721596 [Suillus subluteus]|nr:hypothetical protein F4604DRAFT_1721596 [Suillus subluteus]